MQKLILDEPEAGRFRVSRRVMTDPAIFEREMSEIFDKSWLYLGHDAEIPKPNDFQRRQLAGRQLLFVRDPKGEVRCFFNACSHRGMTICRERSGRASFFSCANHGWTFNTAGTLVSVPEEANFPPTFNKKNFGLTPVRHESYRGFVFVTFDAAAPSLETYLGEAIGYLDLIPDQAEDEQRGMEVLGGTHEYSHRSNWKLPIENSFDGAHVPIVHQRYLEMMVASGMDLTASTMMKDQYVHAMDNGHVVLQSSAGSWGRPGNDAQKEAFEQRRRALEQRHGKAYSDRMFAGPRVMFIFPNFVIIDLVMGVTMRIQDPVSPGFTVTNAWYIAPRGEPDELRALRLDNSLTFWGPAGLSSPDDVAVMEAIQESMGANRDGLWQEISKGLTLEGQCGQDEFALRHFWRRWSRDVVKEELAPEIHAIGSELPRTFSAAKDGAKVAAR